MESAIKFYILSDFVNDYQLPYYEVLSNDPDIEEIMKVVVIEKIRPEILPEWRSNKVLCKKYGCNIA